MRFFDHMESIILNPPAPQTPPRLLLPNGYNNNEKPLTTAKTDVKRAKLVPNLNDEEENLICVII
jgi:hypothetical protein